MTEYKRKASMFGIDLDLAQAIKRADVFCYTNAKGGTFHLVSRNLNAPLTDDEKISIKEHLNALRYPIDVIFDN